MHTFMRYLRRHHIALLALFVALGGTSYAAASKLLPPNSVGTKQVIDNSLLARDFRKGQLPATGKALMWIDHFSLLPGDPSVTTSSDAVNSGVGGGLTALVVHSSTLGEDALGGGNKVVQTAVEVPPHYNVAGVRVCYELTNARSFISQVRLAQLQDPPSTALVILDDGTDRTAVGPTCFDSASTSINPATGALLLSLRVNFGDTSDRIAIRAVGLRLVPGT
jgi:hypothetical protein